MAKKKKSAPRPYVPEPGHENDVRIGPLAKDGDKLLRSVQRGNMVGILSKNEVMYTFIKDGQYRCFIHPMGAEEGRFRSFEDTEPNRAIIKNLASLCDQLFEIEHDPKLDYMGVMVAAEQGIIRFLDSIGQLPAEDFDFMNPDISALQQDGPANPF